jgi:hypothetical protein
MKPKDIDQIVTADPETGELVSRGMMHLVDPDDRKIVSDDLACWLLFYLEAHGADVVLLENGNVQVNLDPMLGLDAEIVGRWAPIVVKLLPEMREILQARRRAVLSS